MIILQGNQLARHFGATVLFENISIRIQDNSRIALVGRNGTGKSTLLKILAKIEKPDQGYLSETKNLTIGYLDQHTAVQSNRTIWEEMLSIFDETIRLHQTLEDISSLLTKESTLQDEVLYTQTLQQYDTIQTLLEEKQGYRYESDIRTVLHGFRFYEQDYHRSISELSGGQKTRLALAKILLSQPQLLILDEPTNHLDMDTLNWLEDYLKHYKGALLIVSHDRYFLDKVVNEVYEISQKKIHYYKGNYSYYLSEKELRLSNEWKAYEKQQEEIAKLEDFVAKNIVRASTTKRAQSRRKQLEKMTRIEKPAINEKSAKFQFVSEKESGQVVLQLEDIAIGYDKPLSQSIHLDLRKQQSFALIGENGIGKTTLLKTILKQLPALNGHIKLGANVQIGYYDQEQQHLSYNKDVLHELWDAFPTLNEVTIRSILGSFLFSGEDVDKLVSALSGGEKARLSLAKLALQKDNFLILDEPTNHLDLDSKQVLEQALIDYDGTLLFISHDRYFINRVATAIIELTPQGIVFYDGDYDYYLEKKVTISKEVASIQSNTMSTSQAHYYTNKEVQKKERQLTRQIEKLEQHMEQLEGEIAAIEEQLVQPDIFSDFEKSLELTNQLQQLKDDYDRSLEEWETLQLALETD